MNIDKISKELREVEIKVASVIAESDYEEFDKDYGLYIIFNAKLRDILILIHELQDFIEEVKNGSEKNKEG